MFGFWIVAVAAVAFASWALLVIELIGTHWFWPWVFRFGLPILQEERLDRAPGPPVRGARFDTSSARFRRIAPGTWLFRRKYRLFAMNSVFKGSLSLRDGRLIARSRWPLGLAGFMGAWLLGWCSAGVRALLQPGEVRNDTGLPVSMMLLAGVALVTAVLAFSLWLERRASRKAIDEFAALASSER